VLRVPGIGLLNEKPLHASLKAWYAQPGDRFEVPVGRFVIDIVRENLLLEIQTGSFASIKSKLAALVESHQIRLIYPIAQEKWIVQLAKDGSRVATRRKSPKRGRVEDLFWNMVSIPQLISSGNLSLEVLMIREEEARRHERGRKWRRKGWVTAERRLLEVVDRRVFARPADWLALLPQGFEPFTARDLAEAMGIRLELAQKMAYSLREAKLVKLIGKRGRANLYAAAS
jgi:ribosomal protein S25